MDEPLSLIIRATAFAAAKHRNQRRKDAEASPYINHPIALASVLANEGAILDPLVLTAALLHDTIEAERKRLQIEHARHASLPARLVKLADKICNLRDLNAAPPAGWSLKRKREYFDWARQVIDQMRGTHEVLESLFDREHARRP